MTKWSPSLTVMQGYLLSFGGQRSQAGYGRQQEKAWWFVPLLRWGWHVTSRMHQQTPDRSGSEIQLSKRGWGGGGLSRCLLAWVLLDAYLMWRTHTRKAITNKNANTHTHKLGLGCIIPDLPAHCGDLSLDQTCGPRSTQVSDQVSADS